MVLARFCTYSVQVSRERVPPEPLVHTTYLHVRNIRIDISSSITNGPKHLSSLGRRLLLGSTCFHDILTGAWSDRGRGGETTRGERKVWRAISSSNRNMEGKSTQKRGCSVKVFSRLGTLELVQKIFQSSHE
jgi:hypothetical protein